MTFAERREMWREKRQMKKWWRVRLVAALVAVVLSIWGLISGDMTVALVVLVVLGLGIFPFLASDLRVDAEWRARRASRRPTE
jgi:fatty acid desaturase